MHLCDQIDHMRSFFFILPLALLGCGNTPDSTKATTNNLQETTTMNFHELSAIDINGKPYDMAQLKGHKVMVMNTARPMRAIWMASSGAALAGLGSAG